MHPQIKPGTVLQIIDTPVNRGCGLSPHQSFGIIQFVKDGFVSVYVQRSNVSGKMNDLGQDGYIEARVELGKFGNFFRMTNAVKPGYTAYRHHKRIFPDDYLKA
jgi:hypothetical protein